MLILVFIPVCTEAQIPATAFEALSDTYNFTYWNSNFKTPGVSLRGFSNQTSSYALNIDYTNLNIASLDIGNNSESIEAAFAMSNNVLFPNAHAGNIDFAVLQGGNVVYA